MEVKTVVPENRADLGFLRFVPAYMAGWLCWYDILQMDSFLPLIVFGLLVMCGFRFFAEKLRKLMFGVLFTGVLVVVVLRWETIVNSLGGFANQVFSASERCQAYEYQFFPVKEVSDSWGVGVVCLLTALVVAGWGKYGVMLLNGVNGIAMAYFGLTPNAFWLTVLFAGLVIAVLPAKGFWKYVLPIGIGIMLLSVALSRVQPNQTVSALEEKLRDQLALHSVSYEKVTQHKEVPKGESPGVAQPVATERDKEQTLNVLFLVLSILTLLVLFVPAALRDHAQKRRERQRGIFTAEDTRRAICAMYLHGNKWKKLEREPQPCPKEIYALWQEAAYSDHPLTEVQREEMRKYLDSLEERIWKNADRKTRFLIKYRLAL